MLFKAPVSNKKGPLKMCAFQFDYTFIDHVYPSILRWVTPYNRFRAQLHQQ